MEAPNESRLTRRELLKRRGGPRRRRRAAPALRGPAHAQTTQKRELVVAQGGDISKFDPHFSTSSNDIRISFNLFDNLTSRHPDGKLAPRPGHRVEAHGADDLDVQAPAGREVAQRRSVHLRRREVQPRAHVGPEREDPREHGPHDDRPGRGARTPTTVVIHTKKPDPLLPARLAFYGGQIVPEEVHRGGGQRRLQRQAGGHRARDASCRGPRTTGSCWRPTPTTGAASPTSTA